MPPVARRWIIGQEQPRDLYELVGLPAFHPRRNEVLAAIRQCTREAVSYQNHADASIASRALRLLHELGRGEMIVSDEARFRDYQQSLVERLREQYLQQSPTSTSHAPERLHEWLRGHGVHPDAVANVASRLLERTHAPRVFGEHSAEAARSMAALPPPGPTPSSAAPRPAPPSPLSRPPADDLAPLESVNQRQRPPFWMLAAAALILIVLLLDVAWMTGLLSRDPVQTGAPATAISSALDPATSPTGGSDGNAPPSARSPIPAPQTEPAPPEAAPTETVVEWSGTLENMAVSPSPRFELRLLVGADNPESVGDTSFEAVVVDQELVEQLSDYLSTNEQLLDFARPQAPGDHVRVSGELASPDRPRLLAAATSPLVELRAIERVGESGSRAEAGAAPRAETSYRFPAPVRALQSLIRIAPTAGTSVTVQGFFRERYADDGTIFIAPQSGPRGVEAFTSSLPVDQLNIGDWVELTGTYQGETAVRQTDQGIAQRPVLHAESVRPIAAAMLEGSPQPAESVPIGAHYRGPALLVAGEDGAAALRRGNDWYRLNFDDRAPGRLRWCLVDHEQACWLCGERGIVCLSDGPPLSWTSRDGAPTGPVVHLSEDSRRRIWATSENGICGTLADGQWRLYGQSTGLRPTQLAACIEDGAGRVWAVGAGVSVFQQETFVGDELGPQLGLTILSADVDAEGRVYFGCVGGLFRVDGLNVASLTEDDGLPPETTIAVYVDSQQRVWLGTAGGGALHLSVGEFAVESRHTLPGNLQVSRFTEDSDGVIWAATQQGLWQFEDESWSIFELPPEYAALSLVATLPEEAAEELWTWAGGERIDLAATASGQRRSRLKDREARPLTRIGVTSPLTGRAFRVQTGVPRRTIQNALGAPAFEHEYVFQDGRATIDVFVCPKGAAHVSLLLVGYDDSAEQSSSYLDAELDVPLSDSVLQANLVADLVKSYESRLRTQANDD